MSDQNLFANLRQSARETASSIERSTQMLHDLNEDLSKIKLNVQQQAARPTVPSTCITTTDVAATTTTSGSEALSRSKSEPKTLGELRRLALGKNQRIEELRSENAELKMELLEHQMAIEAMMAQYRKQVDLLGQVQQCRQSLEEYDSGARSVAEAEVIAATDRLQGMVKTSEKVSEYTEAKLLELRETLAQLRAEHRGLLEMYRIAKQFGSIESHQEDHQETSSASSSVSSPTSSATPPTVEEPMANNDNSNDHDSKNDES